MLLNGLIYTCEEACTELGPWGPMLMMVLFLLSKWIRAEFVAKKATKAAEAHKEEAQELRVKVASLSPPPGPPAVPVIVNIPIQAPPPADLLQAASSDSTPPEE